MTRTSPLRSKAVAGSGRTTRPVRRQCGSTRAAVKRATRELAEIASRSQRRLELPKDTSAGAWAGTDNTLTAESVDAHTAAVREIIGALTLLLVVGGPVSTMPLEIRGCDVVVKSTNENLFLRACTIVLDKRGVAT